MSRNKLALVAGEGELPLELLRAMRRDGSDLPEVYLMADNEEPYNAENIPFVRIKNPLAIAMTLTKMRLKGVRRMMMAGRVPKQHMYVREKQDEGARKILSDVSDRNDHSLLAGVVRYIEKFGITVVSYEEAVPGLMAAEGHIAGPVPSEEQIADGAYGTKILSVTLPLSFGQGVIVSRCAAVAVEAMEGTDAMINRAGSLCRGGVLVKGMRSDQDRRYDLPVVGPETLENMKKNGLSALFIQSGSVMILKKEKFIEYADANGISVTGVPACQFL